MKITDLEGFLKPNRMTLTKHLTSKTMLKFQSGDNECAVDNAPVANHSADYCLTNILMYMRTRNFPKKIDQRVLELFRRCLKSSYFSFTRFDFLYETIESRFSWKVFSGAVFLSFTFRNYCDDETASIGDSEDCHKRKIRMIRSLLLGDEGHSVVTKL